jgi:hypothetical protein
MRRAALSRLVGASILALAAFFAVLVGLHDLLMRTDPLDKVVATFLIVIAIFCAASVPAHVTGPRWSYTVEVPAFWPAWWESICSSRPS